MVFVKRKRLYRLILVFVCIFSLTLGAEAVDTDSPQFAAQAETETYKIKYNNPEEIANKLSEPGVKIKPLLSKNMLVVQALPEKMKEIENRLNKIDSPANPYQVKYNLYIMELKSDIVDGLGLREMELKKDSEDNFWFLTQKNLVELAGEGVISYLKSRLQKTQASMKKIAQPSLIAGINNTASISLNKEIVNQNQEEFKSSEEFNLKLTPESVIPESEEVTTTINFNSSSVINTELSTSIKTAYNKPQLIAVFSQNKQSSNISSLNTVDNKEEFKYFAMYLAACPIGSLSNNSRTFNLGGLNNLLQKKDINKPIRERMDILFNSDINIDISVQDQKEKRGFNFEIKEKNGNNSPYLQLGPDFYLLENLKLGTYFQIKDNINSFKIGLKERVKVSRGFQLTAGYYPWLYNINSNEMVNEKNWWIQSEFQYSRLFLDLKYSEFKSSILKSSWRGLIGCRVFQSWSIVAGVEKEKNEEKKFIGGLTIKTW